MKKALLLYLPVIHQGYTEFLWKHRDAEAVFLIGQNLIKELASIYPEEISLRSLMRDPRCLGSGLMQILVQQVLSRTEIHVLDSVSDIRLEEYDTFVMPDEDFCRFFSFTYPRIFEGKKVEYELTFLRWDMPSSIANVHVDSDYTIASDDLVRLGLESVQDRAFTEAYKSSDWWRQVGGVLFKGEEILLTSYNRHLPTELETAFKGDPRSNFQAGQYIEFSSAIHAEAGLVGAAASRGICTKGLEIFTTTFPCPACAALIATSGLKRLYFVDGYSNVNALQTLREYGVEIVRVV